MKAPPLLPDETLARVLQRAQLDGLSILAVAAFFALLSAVGSDLTGMAIGLLVTAAGAIELHGAGLLRAGDARGMAWVCVSQLYLLVVVLIYCGYSIGTYAPSELDPALRPIVSSYAQQTGWSEPTLLWRLHLLRYGLLAGVTLIYQGAMAVYYLRRRMAVAAALDVGA